MQSRLGLNFRVVPTQFYRGENKLSAGTKFRGGANPILPDLHGTWIEKPIPALYTL